MALKSPQKILLPGALLVVALVWLNRPQPETPAAGPSGGQTPAPPAPAVAVAKGAGFQPLAGRWVRPDGGYVLEIKSAADNGQLDAAYFNPNPIHVAKAEATRDAGALKVFVELRDVNYPGSTYTLTLEPSADVLKGIYFQAVAQERYEIFFERLK